MGMKPEAKLLKELLGINGMNLDGSVIVEQGTKMYRSANILERYGVVERNIIPGTKFYSVCLKGKLPETMRKIVKGEAVVSSEKENTDDQNDDTQEAVSGNTEQESEEKGIEAVKTRSKRDEREREEQLIKDTEQDDSDSENTSGDVGTDDNYSDISECDPNDRVIVCIPGKVGEEVGFQNPQGPANFNTVSMKKNKRGRGYYWRVKLTYRNYKRMVNYLINLKQRESEKEDRDSGLINQINETIDDLDSGKRVENVMKAGGKK